MNLFSKLALAISTLLIIITLGLSVSYYWIEERGLRRQAEQERFAVLQNVVHMARESFLADDDLLLVKYASWLPEWTAALESVSVTDAAGRIMAHSEPNRIGKDAQPTLRTESLSLSQPVTVGTHRLGTASVSFARGYYDALLRERLGQLQKRVLWVAGPVLAGGLLLSFLLALSWSRTIGRLAAAADRVGEGAYDFDLHETENRGDELGALARRFTDMAGRLKELDTLKEDFVSAVTHELRSPLGAIESFLNLIQDEIRQGAETTAWPDYIERMRSNTARLNRFINDLLDVAALERGKVAIKPEPLAMDRLTQEVLDLFSARFRERNLLARLEMPEALPPALADAEKLRQVLVNLLSNAVKFTPPGGTITLRVEAMLETARLRVSVRDTGIGISTADQRKIFSKFEQVRSARQTAKGPKGTGLGLSISKALIELHGGHLGVFSTPGQGSTFFFEIPLAPQRADLRKPELLRL